jgi:tape measure domain-containing protein
MATDVERLMVRIEADITKYERAMSRATGVMDRQTRQMKKKLDEIDQQIGNDLAASAKRFGAVLAGAISVDQIRQAADAFIRVQNALKVAGLAGEDLRTTYEALFASAQRQGTSLEATATLYGRLAASQKELKATSAELLTFTDGVGLALRVAGTDAEKASGALLQLAQAMGGGTVQAEEYNSLIDGALPVLQAVATGLVEAGGSVAKLTALVKDGEVSSQAFFRAFLAGLPKLEKQAESTSATSSQAFQRLKNSMENLVGQLDQAGKFTGIWVDALGGASSAADALAGKLPGLISKMQELAKEYPTLAQALNYGGTLTADRPADRRVLSLEQIQNRRLRDEVERKIAAGIIRPDAVAEQRAKLAQLDYGISTTAATGLRSSAAIDAASEAAKRAAEPITGAEERIARGLRGKVSLKDHPAPGKDKKGGGGGSNASEYEREAAAIRQRTAALAQEAQTVGMSAYAADRATAAFELMEAAKRSGLEVTPALRAQIDALAEAHARAGETVRAAAEAFEQSNELARFGGQEISGFLSDIVSGGKNAEEALMNLTKRLADAALQAALLGEGPLAALFGTRSATGGVGGLIGALFNGMFGGARAAGGPVSAGKAYLVGEKGPEMMVPNRSGTIVPNDVLAGAVPKAGGGANIVITQNFAAGVTHRELAQIVPAIRQSAIDGVRDGLARGRI